MNVEKRKKIEEEKFDVDVEKMIEFFLECIMTPSEENKSIITVGDKKVLVMPTL